MTIAVLLALILIAFLIELHFGRTDAPQSRYW